MASKETKMAVRDIMKCSICKDAFKTPKCLPCIHTFCLECLEKYGEDERPGGGTIFPAAQRALLCAAQPSCGAAGPADARLGTVRYRIYNRIARCKAGIIDSRPGKGEIKWPAA